MSVDLELAEELKKSANKTAELIGKLSAKGWNISVKFGITENQFRSAEGGWDNTGGRHFATVSIEKKVSL